MGKIGYFLGIAVVAALFMFGLAFTGKASATQVNGNDDKVTICHATSSNTNPYTENTISKSSVDNPGNQYLNGHGDHTGPVWYPGINTKWGDIIPPFSYGNTNFPGQNWTSEGQEIWENGCEYKSDSEGPKIVFDVACVNVEDKDMVAVTFKNFGGTKGKAYLNGEKVKVSAGDTVVVYVELGVNIEIVIDEKTVYNQTPDCVEEETPPVVQGVQTVAPAGPVSAGVGGATSTLAAAAAVLSVGTLGFGLRRLGN